MTEFATVLAEIEAHVAADGWDQPPRLYALAPTVELLRAEPALAASVGLDRGGAAALTPVEQEALSDQPLDEVLAGITWPAEVLGCAVVTEATVLPPGSGHQAPTDAAKSAEWAAGHPDRREVRMAVGVLRDGSRAATLRLRGEPDDLLTGPDLAPNLTAALAATLVE